MHAKKKNKSRHSRLLLLPLLLVGAVAGVGVVGVGGVPLLTVGALRPLTGLFSAVALRKFSRQILIVPPSKFIYRIKKS